MNNTKPKFLTSAGALALFAVNLLGRLAVAQEYEGYSLSLGVDVGQSNYIVHGSAAIGLDNNLTYPRSFALGAWNDSDHLGTILFGDGNWLQGGSSNLVGGQANYLANANSMFVIGLGNTMGVGSSYFQQCNNSMLAGSFNSVGTLKDSIVSGSMNAVTRLVSGGVIGTGLVIGDQANHFVVGTYNSAGGALFTVGNGVGSNQRSNAFVVYPNGDVVIKKPQGDILMGVFGN